MPQNRTPKMTTTDSVRIEESVENPRQSSRESSIEEHQEESISRSANISLIGKNERSRH